MLKIRFVQIFIICALFMAFGASAQLTMPRPSPAATLSQRIGLTDISISYSRPQVIRGNTDRTGQIWGNQVPWGLADNAFGNQEPMPWRAGANENTVMTFSTDVNIEGKKLPAGSYGVHMIPYEDGKVTVIFNSNTSAWGSFFYESAKDVLRVDTKLQDAPLTNVLTFEFTSFGPNRGVLALLWDTKQVPLTISIDQEVILQSFRNELTGAQGFGWQGPLSAATYCLNNNFNHEEAIKWADQAISVNKNGQTLGLKAALLFQIGKNAEAVKVTEEAKEIATTAELNALGYQLVGANQFEKAEEFFKLNIKKNPKDANCYDSMGECYVAMGKKEDAIKMFKKSLSLNPSQFVKNNSIANLKRLGVEYSE